MAREMLLWLAGAAESGYTLAGKGFAAGQISVMVKRIALFRIVSFCFCMCAACGAFCQSAHFQNVGPEIASASKSLPDAPSARLLTQTHPLQTISISNDLQLPVTATAAGIPNATARFQAALVPQADQHSDQQKSSALFFKHLYPSLMNPNLRYRASDNESVMGRATDAASRILLTRDQSGKRRFNTTYFLRLATSIAADSASRKYRARSKTAPLSDFGSNVGNDAGMNLLHEFGPGLQQALTSHLPKFVSRIEARLVH
jgi:hypothetical protein